MPRRRLLGWEPVETSRGYDAEGNQVAIADAWEIRTTREPEWSDTDRDELLALAHYEAGISPCGHHESLTQDAANNFFEPRVETCPVCAGLEQYRRHLAKQDEREAKDLDGTPLAQRASDGRRAFMARLTGAEVEARRAQRDAARAERDALDGLNETRSDTRPDSGSVTEAVTTAGGGASD